jgi:hypothetical protein
VELADQGEPIAVAMAEPGDLMGAVAGVADEDERPIGESDPHQPEQPAHQLGRGAVRPIAAAIILDGPIEVDQDRPSPGPGGEGEADRHGQDDPLVTVSPGGVAGGGSDRVAVTGLAVDLLAGMAIDGVVADEEDRAIGDQVGAEEAGRDAAEPRGRPGGAGEDS